MGNWFTKKDDSDKEECILNWLKSQFDQAHGYGKELRDICNQNNNMFGFQLACPMELRADIVQKIKPCTLTSGLKVPDDSAIIRNALFRFNQMMKESEKQYIESGKVPTTPNVLIPAVHYWYQNGWITTTQPNTNPKIQSMLFGKKRVKSKSTKNIKKSVKKTRTKSKRRLQK